MNSTCTQRCCTIYSIIGSSGAATYFNEDTYSRRYRLNTSASYLSHCLEPLYVSWLYSISMYISFLLKMIITFAANTAAKNEPFSQKLPGNAAAFIPPLTPPRFATALHTCHILAF